MSKVSDAAGALEEAFFRCVPTGKKLLSESDWTRALAKFQTSAREIRDRHGLGVIGRARAAYLLQQRLMAAGLPGGVVRKVVFALVLNSFSG